jgi:hypothetical protein
LTCVSRTTGYGDANPANISVGAATSVPSGKQIVVRSLVSEIRIGFECTAVDGTGASSTYKSYILWDVTAPRFDCPSPFVVRQGSATTLTSEAIDDWDVFRSDQDSIRKFVTVQLNTSVLGSRTASVSVADLAGNIGNGACAYEVVSALPSGTVVAFDEKSNWTSYSTSANQLPVFATFNATAGTKTNVARVGQYYVFVYGAGYVVYATPVAVTNVKEVRFWINGGPNGISTEMFVANEGPNTIQTGRTIVSAPANTWKEVVLTSAELPGLSSVNRIEFAAPGGIFFLDEIALVTGGSTPPTTVPVTTVPVTTVPVTTVPVTTVPVTTVPVTTVPVTTVPVTTVPVTTVPVTTVPVTTVPTNGVCRASVAVTPYYGGYSAIVSVTNTSGAVLNDWLINVTLPAGQTFQYTGSNLTPAGTTATVRPTEGGHRGIAPGGSVNVSWFNANSAVGVPPAPPTVSCSAAGSPVTTMPVTTSPVTTVPVTTVPVTTVPVTTSPVTTVPASTVPSGGCQAVGTVSAKWFGGYAVAVSITNKSATVLNSWTVAVTLPSGHKIVQASNQFTSGSTFVAINASDKGISSNETRSVIWFNVDTGSSTAVPSISATCR